MMIGNVNRKSVNHRSTSPVVALVMAAAIGFIVFGLAVIAGTLAVAGRPPPAWVTRVPLVRGAAMQFEQADAQLTRRRDLLVRATIYQLAIVLLDAATMWALVRSVGEAAPAAGVFASFMISSLLRTLGILPGGLGTFEAASVLTLELVGVPVAGALAATLLFRGLTFWLPMLPGLLLSRAIRRAR